MPRGAKKGHLVSKETREKMRKTHLGRNNPMYKKQQSDKCKEINRKRMIGNTYAKGNKRPDLIILNKNRIGIPLKEETKEKIRIILSKYWQTSKGLEQKEKLSIINKQWAKDNPEKKIKSAKNGHKFCPRISSLEIKFRDELEKRNIFFIPQYEWSNGFMDFFIPPNIAVFVDGSYWHNSSSQKDKDTKQNIILNNMGYKIFRFWEKDIEKSVSKCVDKIIVWEKELKNRESLNVKLNTFHQELSSIT